LANNQAILFVI